MYKAVFKAAFDYDHPARDELAIKAGQLLFLLDASDDDWWRVKIVNARVKDAESGLVPAAYVEEAKPLHKVLVLYSFDANDTDSLSIHPGQQLDCFTEDDAGWLLARAEKADGFGIGFIPTTYVKPIEEEHQDAHQHLSATGLDIPKAPSPNIDGHPVDSHQSFTTRFPQVLPDPPPSTSTSHPPKSHSAAPVHTGAKEINGEALYDFTPIHAQELAVLAGDELILIENVGDDWVKCRKVNGGAEGLVPSSYADFAQAQAPEPSTTTAKVEHEQNDEQPFAMPTPEPFNFLLPTSPASPSSQTQAQNQPHPFSSASLSGSSTPSPLPKIITSPPSSTPTPAPGQPSVLQALSTSSPHRRTVSASASATSPSASAAGSVNDSSSFLSLSPIEAPLPSAPLPRPSTSTSGSAAGNGTFKRRRSLFGGAAGWPTSPTSDEGGGLGRLDAPLPNTPGSDGAPPRPPDDKKPRKGLTKWMSSFSIKDLANASASGSGEKASTSSSGNEDGDGVGRPSISTVNSNVTTNSTSSADSSNAKGKEKAKEKEKEVPTPRAREVGPVNGIGMGMMTMVVSTPSTPEELEREREKEREKERERQRKKDEEQRKKEDEHRKKEEEKARKKEEEREKVRRKEEEKERKREEEAGRTKLRKAPSAIAAMVAGRVVGGGGGGGGVDLLGDPFADPSAGGGGGPVAGGSGAGRRPSSAAGVGVGIGVVPPTPTGTGPGLGMGPGGVRMGRSRSDENNVGGWAAPPPPPSHEVWEMPNVGIGQSMMPNGNALPYPPALPPRESPISPQSQQPPQSNYDQLQHQIRMLQSQLTARDSEMQRLRSSLSQAQQTRPQQGPTSPDMPQPPPYRAEADSSASSSSNQQQVRELQSRLSEREREVRDLRDACGRMQNDLHMSRQQHQHQSPFPQGAMNSGPGAGAGPHGAPMSNDARQLRAQLEEKDMELRALKANMESLNQSNDQRVQRLEEGVFSQVMQLSELHDQFETMKQLHAQEMENVLEHVLCEVCMEKLWTPYILAECGHTFCAGCIVDWFRSNPTDLTCPHCRKNVTVEPVEMFFVKSLVKAVTQAQIRSGTVKGDASGDKEPPKAEVEENKTALKGFFSNGGGGSGPGGGTRRMGTRSSRPR